MASTTTTTTTTTTDVGGLPGWAKYDEVTAQIDDLSERLANLAGYMGDVASAEGDDIEIPFAVESEHVAVVGLLAHDLREAARALDRFADSMAGAQWSIDRVRRTQEANRGR